MVKMGKKLTDRELIDAVLAWYNDDQSAEQLREAVSAYVQQNAIVPAVALANDFGKYGALEEHEAGSNELCEANYAGAKPNAAERIFEAQDVGLFQPFEPSDGIVGNGGWMIDFWALYYALEDFIHWISFGLLTMKRMAIMVCMLISTGVIIGAWQSSRSSERQKKATFKSMNVESDKNRIPYSVSEVIDSPPQESMPAAAAEPSAPSSNVTSVPTALDPSIKFDAAIEFMEKADWNDALANLQILENEGGSDLQPLSTLIRVEALIRKRDVESMELARQLLMDCKSSEYELVYDLLVTRWILLGSAEDRKRFLNEAASLPESARQRMSIWAHIRNGNKDELTGQTLESSAPKGQSAVCDLLFMASLHFNQGNRDETIRELLEAQQKLKNLLSSGENKVVSWLLETAKLQLSSKVDEILALVNRQQSKQFN